MLRQRLPLWATSAALTLLAACSHDIAGQTPTISGPGAPALVCNAQKTFPVDVSGGGFSPLPIDTATDRPARIDLPQIDLTSQADLTGAPIAAPETTTIPDDPYAPADSQVHWTSLSSMQFDVTESLMLDEGIYGLTVTNRNGNVGTRDAALAVVPPPTLSSVQPMAICIAQGSVTLQLVGTGFLRVEDPPGAFAQPSVTFSGAGLTTPLTLTGAVDLASCVKLPAPAANVDRCTRMTVVVPQDAVPPGSYQVMVTNPPPADCHSTESITVDVVPPPTLTDVNPNRLCAGGGTLTLTGMDFRPGATVSVGATDTTDVTVDNTGTSAVAVFGAGLTPSPTPLDVTITNPEGCFSTLPMRVTVVDGPILFWVDPPVAYNALRLSITLYASGLNGNPTSVSLVDANGVATNLVYTRDPLKGRIQATVEPGLAVGVYDVHVMDVAGCPAVLPNALTVIDTTDRTITGVSPPFAYQPVDTAVTIDVAAGGLTGAERLYLNPVNSAGSPTASPLRAVSLVSPTRLSAVVPANLPVGSYDLILVTSDGHLAVLDAGITVTAASPPIIDNVTPGEVDNGGVRTVTARGTGFGTLSAAWECRNFGTGAVSTPAATVVSNTATSASVTIDASALQAGDVCVLTLTNDDGLPTETFGIYSAVAVTLPSSNVPDFVADTPMNTARRALSLAVSQSTREARYLHAIGGDDPTLATPTTYDTIETIAVDPFGVMGASWYVQPNRLPGARRFARVERLGDYLYLVGGNDGNQNLRTVHRAEVLDPLDSPEVSDITATRRGTGTDPGLGAGLWYYRVAAVFGPGDARNPDGESLPSDPLVVQLPASIPDTLYLTLEWPTIAGAVAYRIYRSPTVDAPLSQVELLAEQAATATTLQTFLDTGLATMAGTSPLPPGALGKWAPMPQLSVERGALATAIAVDPTTPTRFYLYAFGGRDAANAPSNSWEYLTIDVAPNGTQTVGGAFTAGGTTLSVARSELAAFVVDNDRASRVPAGQTWIYLGAGRTAGGTTSTVEAGIVLPGGQLCGTPQAGTPTTCTTPAFIGLTNFAGGASQAGYAYAARNDFLYVFGGGPTASNASVSGELCGTGVAGCQPAVPDPPEIASFTNAGTRLTTERYLAGSATEGAFVYVVGGVNAAGAVLATTDRDVL